MGPIRPCQVSNLSAVADLFWKVFRRRSAPAPPSLPDYLQTLYFTHPDYDPDLGALVYEDTHANIRGFIGGIPLCLRLDDRPLRALVGGNHMVDPDLNDPLAGALLLRRFFAGPQDLTYSDTANPISVKLWESLGADILTPYSIRWLRVLRPGRFASSILRRHRLGMVGSILFYPFFALVDRIGQNSFSPPVEEFPDSLDQRELDPDTFIPALPKLTGARLRPDYNRARLDWRLTRAGEKKEFGELVKTAVFQKNRLLGWYLFYTRPGDLGHVLQVVARPRTLDRVLNHLFAHARRRGCVALLGYTDAKSFSAYTRTCCQLFLRGALAMAHARDPQLLQPLHHGEAFLSRLEGEWWTRLQGDRFL